MGRPREPRRDWLRAARADADDEDGPEAPEVGRDARGLESRIRMSSLDCRVRPGADRADGDDSGAREEKRLSVIPPEGRSEVARPGLAPS